MLKKAEGATDEIVRDGPNDQTKRTGWRRYVSLLRSYGVPLLLVIVAAHQMYRVHGQGLNAWRGGGFGMYSGFHPRHTDIWLFRTDTGESKRYAKYDGTADAETALVRPNITFVNNDRLRSLRQQLPPNERKVTNVQTWQLDFDPDSMTLRRRLLAEATAEED